MLIIGALIANLIPLALIVKPKVKRNRNDCDTSAVDNYNSMPPSFELDMSVDQAKTSNVESYDTDVLTRRLSEDEKVDAITAEADDSGMILSAVGNSMNKGNRCLDTSRDECVEKRTYLSIQESEVLCPLIRVTTPTDVQQNVVHTSAERRGANGYNPDRNIEMSNPLPNAEEALHLVKDENVCDKSGEGQMVSIRTREDRNSEPIEDFTHKTFPDAGNRTVQWLGNKLDVLKKTDFITDPCLTIILLTNLPFGVIYGGWHSFLIPRAESREVSVVDIFVITFAAAVAYFFGRTVVGILSQRLGSPTGVFIILTILNIVSLLLDVFIHEFIVLVVAAFASAISISGRTILEILIAKDRASGRHFALILPLYELVLGVGIALGGFLSGLFIQL